MYKCIYCGGDMLGAPNETTYCPKDCDKFIEQNDYLGENAQVWGTNPLPHTSTAAKKTNGIKARLLARQMLAGGTNAHAILTMMRLLPYTSNIKVVTNDENKNELHIELMRGCDISHLPKEITHLASVITVLRVGRPPGILKSRNSGVFTGVQVHATM